MLPLVRAGALSGYKQLLHNYGVDADVLLKRLSLPASYIDEPDQLISLETLVELLDLGAQLSGCQHFGLKLAQQQDLSVLGVIGLLIQQSATVRDAWVASSSHLSQHVQELDIWLEEQEELAFLRFSYRLPSRLIASRQHNDITLVNIFNILNTLCNGQLKLRSVYLCGETPASLEPYTELLRAPVVFGCDSNALVFNRSYLDMPVVGANPLLKRMLNNYLETSHCNDFAGQVRRIIANLLPRRAVTLNEVAECIGIAPRTLQSKLSKSSLTFQQVLDAVRIDQVCRYMLEGRMSLTEISELVGYSQLSALTRCFMRVKGCNPGDWRKRQDEIFRSPLRDL